VHSNESSAVLQRNSVASIKEQLRKPEQVGLLALPFEELYLAFVFFGLLKGIKGAEVLALASLRI
jgi:hypothetical protein